MRIVPEISKWIVVDNNSTDRTRNIVENLAPTFSHLSLRYVFEPRQGRSFAVNRGLDEAIGDLVSAIDDDEEIAPDWLVEVAFLFKKRGSELDFAGGKILPTWESDPPEWIEPLKLGVICWRDFGDDEWEYTTDSPLLTGGHGIFKRSVFEELGKHDEEVGAQAKGFISGEDEVFYDLLMKAGMRGVYCPKLVIFHYVPTYRLSKAYYRTWLFGVGISRSLAHRKHGDSESPKILGVPRWMYRSAAKGVFEKAINVIRRRETESLAAENQPMVFAGYFYDRNQTHPVFRKVFQVLSKAVPAVQR